MRGSTTFPLPGLLLALAASAVLGCHHGPPPSEGESEAESNAEIAIRVDNHNFLDVTIHLIHNGQRIRIRMVTGSSSATFFVNSRVIGRGGDIRLLGDPVGSPGQVVTETLQVQPGQYIEWTLETDLQRSSVAVY